MGLASEWFCSSTTGPIAVHLEGKFKVLINNDTLIRVMTACMKWSFQRCIPYLIYIEYRE